MKRRERKGGEDEENVEKEKREKERKRGRKKKRMRGRRKKEKEGRRRGEEGPIVSCSVILTDSLPKKPLQRTFLITFPNDGLPYEDH